jgi:hypothetical protein
MRTVSRREIDFRGNERSATKLCGRHRRWQFEPRQREDTLHDSRRRPHRDRFRGPDLGVRLRRRAWLVVGFVLLAVNSYITDGAIRAVCWIAAFILVVFNTASIVAMVQHYSHDKDYIYGMDIRHLDAGR